MLRVGVLAVVRRERIWPEVAAADVWTTAMAPPHAGIICVRPKENAPDVVVCPRKVG